jgi:RHS repeat-associated protein
MRPISISEEPPMRKFAIVVLCLLFVLAAKRQLDAQNYAYAIGNQSFSTQIPIENGFINVNTGEIHIEIPLATHLQRGSLPLNESLVYDSRIWQIVNNNGSLSWQPTNVPNSIGGWRLSPSATAAPTYSSFDTEYGSCGPGQEQLPTQEAFWSFAWTDPQGTNHLFDAGFDQQLPIPCDPNQQPASTAGYALDGSGYYMTMTYDPNIDGVDSVVYDGQGNQVYPLLQDPNGNYMSTDANGNLIDTLGRTPVLTSTSGNQIYYDVLSNGGARLRYTVTTETVDYLTLFNQIAVSDVRGSFTAIQSIQLPDGSSYSFTYDNSYGELGSITLPTGSVIQYSYQNFYDSFNNNNRWLHQRVKDGGTTTFAPATISSCTSNAGCQEKTTVTSPDGNDTVYTFTLDPGSVSNASSWNTGITAYQGTSSGGTSLKSASTTYTYSTTSMTGLPSGTATYMVPQSATVVTSLPDIGLASKIATSFDSIGANPTIVQMWDYYSGSASSTPTKQINYSYYSVNGANLPAQIGVTDGGGNLASQTTYNYDQTTPIATSGLPNHNSVSGSRGNVTSISRWLNTAPGSPLITNYTVDDSGMVTAVKDPNGNSSTITYQCFNALPAQATNALGQPTTYGYDCNSGAITSVSDPNDIAANRSGTTYSYEGTAGRLQSISYPDGGQTTYSYPSSAEVDTSVLASPSPSIISQDIADSFGRKYQHIQAGVSSETTYDANGRVSCVTNPHLIASSSSTDGSTCITSYDGLDRPLVQQLPDDNTLRWSYSGNSTTSTDEAGNQWVRTSNAFGVLTNVAEPTGAATGYVYNGLGNLNTITQNGVSETPRIRGFVYDSLSRLTSETNPESGTTSFVYDANGNVHTETTPAPNSAPGSGQTVTTTYNYDPLNRVTQISYSDGQTPTRSFGYDQTSVWMGPQYNTIGRLSQAITAADMRFFGNAFRARCNPQTSATANYDPASGNPTYCNWTAELYSYDSMGRANRIGTAFPSEAGWAAHETDLTYDLAGNMTSLRYPDGRVVAQGLDAAGHQQSVTFDNWNGQHVGYAYASFTYTPPGAQAEAWYGNGIYIHTPYNSRQQMCQVWSNGTQGWIDTHIYYGGSTIYCNSTPGNNGNITQIKDWMNPNRTRYFGYDPLNRLASFSNGDSSMNQSYSYDSFGNMNQSGTLSFQGNYGANANNQINLTGYSYDGAGNLIGANNGMSSFAYSYDAEGRIFNVNAGVDYYTYDAAGERMRKDANGDYTEYQYLNGQPIAEKHSDGTWSDYIYANGEKIARADSFNRYIQFTGNFSSTGNYGEMNLSPVSPSLINQYVIQSGDKLVWRQNQSQAYGGVYFFTTDGSNAAWTLTDQNGEYGNDSMQTDGNWHVRSVDLSPFEGKTVGSVQLVAEGNSPPGSWTLQFADIAVVGADGTALPIYNGGTAVSASPWGTSGYTQPAIGVQSIPSATGDTTYYIGDQLGSTRLTMSSSGWPLSSYTYYPFGQEQNPTLDPNHYKFTGQERDAESNLDYFEARHYSFAAGRFMSPDPYDGSMDLRYPQTLNRYSYVGNNPLGYTDPTGLDGNPISVIGGLGGCLGAAGSGGGDLPADIGCGISLLSDIFGLFSHPSFQGSLTPRPDNHPIWDEHGGFHANPYSSIAAMIGDVDGFSTPGCEFGACGGGFGFQSADCGCQPLRLPQVQGYPYWLIPVPFLSNVAQQLYDTMSKGGKGNVGHDYVRDLARTAGGDYCSALKDIVDAARRSGNSKLFNDAKATYKQDCRGY